MRLCVLVVCLGLRLLRWELFSVVLIEWLRLKQCCVEMCRILFVMHGSSVFSRVFAIIERSEMDLYDVPMFLCLLGFGISIMYSSFHMLI